MRVVATDGERTVVEGLTASLAPGDEVVVTGVDLAYPGAPLLVRAPVGSGAGPAGGEVD